MNRRHLLLTAAGLGLQGPAAAQTGSPKMKTFLYMLRLVPRLHAEAAWTEADRRAVGVHFQHLKAATDAGTVVLAGRTDEALATTFGLVVFEAADAAAAEEFMKADPAVVAGVMTAELHPFSLALLRQQQGR
ncbi:MAG: YciI family protein [Proteobacteria bacterium]|nr:YciI family protein [Pseudomonadota bacterium]